MSPKPSPKNGPELEFIRPMSRQAYLTSKQLSRIVPTDEYTQMLGHIDRYARGSERGFSMLVSALRGMGKTTTVLHAINHHQREENTSFDKSRLIEVELDAPSIYYDFIQNLPDQNSVSQIIQREDLDTSHKLIFRDTFLKQIVTNLYRRVAREFSYCFEEKQREIANHSPHNNIRHKELLGKLNLALMQTANTSVYRKIWEQIGVLERGVLFNSDSKYTPPDSKSIQHETRKRDPEQENQGIKEVTSIAVLTNSFRKIAGNYGVSSSDKKEKENQTTVGITSNFSAADILALISLIIAGSIWLAEVKPQLGGVIAATLSAGFFGFSFVSNWKRTSLQKEEQQFDLDTKSETISRDLPYLLDNIKRCGLAPVFIVDEMDKLSPNELEHFLQMLSMVKHIVTEKSFFIYLCGLSITEKVYETDFDVGRYSSLFKSRFQLTYDTRATLKWMYDYLYGNTTDQPLPETPEQPKVLCWCLNIILRAQGNMLKINQHMWHLRDKYSQSSHSYNLQGEGTDEHTFWLHVAMLNAIDLVAEDPHNQTIIQQDVLAKVYLREALFYAVIVWEQLAHVNFKEQEKKTSIQEFILGKRERYADFKTYLFDRFDFDCSTRRDPNQRSWFRPEKLVWLAENVIKVFQLLSEMKPLFKQTYLIWLGKELKSNFINPEKENNFLCSRDKLGESGDLYLQYDRKGTLLHNLDTPLSEMDAYLSNLLLLLESLGESAVNQLYSMQMIPESCLPRPIYALHMQIQSKEAKTEDNALESQFLQVRINWERNRRNLQLCFDLALQLSWISYEKTSGKVIDHFMQCLQIIADFVTTRETNPINIENTLEKLLVRKLRNDALESIQVPDFTVSRNGSSEEVSRFLTTLQNKVNGEASQSLESIDFGKQDLLWLDRLIGKIVPLKREKMLRYKLPIEEIEFEELVFLIRATLTKSNIYTNPNFMQMRLGNWKTTLDHYAGFNTDSHNVGQDWILAFALFAAGFSGGTINNLSKFANINIAQGKQQVEIDERQLIAAVEFAKSKISKLNDQPDTGLTDDEVNKLTDTLQLLANAVDCKSLSHEQVAKMIEDADKYQDTLQSHNINITIKGIGDGENGAEEYIARMLSAMDEKNKSIPNYLLVTKDSRGSRVESEILTRWSHSVACGVLVLSRSELREALSSDNMYGELIKQSIDAVFAEYDPFLDEPEQFNIGVLAMDVASTFQKDYSPQNIASRYCGNNFAYLTFGNERNTDNYTAYLNIESLDQLHEKYA